MKQFRSFVCKREYTFQIELTHFRLNWKHQKMKDFLFSWCIEKEQRPDTG